MDYLFPPFLIETGKMFLFNPDLGDNFIGRDKEIAFMIEQFRLGQSVVLTAPRRFGKTSLIKEIFKRLKERHFFTAYVNIFTVTSINSLAAETREETDPFRSNH